MPDPTPPTTNAVRHDVRVRPRPADGSPGAAEAARCELPGAADADSALPTCPTSAAASRPPRARMRMLTSSAIRACAGHLPAVSATMRLLSLIMRVRATSVSGRLGSMPR
jgi:hypothetical protein